MSTGIKICHSGRHKLSRVLTLYTEKRSWTQSCPSFHPVHLQSKEWDLQSTRMEPRALRMSVKCSLPELYLQPHMSRHGVPLGILEGLLSSLSAKFWDFSLDQKFVESRVTCIHWGKKKKKSLLSHLPSGHPPLFALKGKIHYDVVNTLWKGQFVESQGHPSPVLSGLQDGYNTHKQKKAV